MRGVLRERDGNVQALTNIPYQTCNLWHDVPCISLNNKQSLKSAQVRGDRLITGSYDTTVRVHSLGSPREQHVYTRHTGDVNCVSASFARIASGSDDHSIWIHDFSPQAEGRAFANRTWLVAALVVLGERLRCACVLCVCRYFS